MSLESKAKIFLYCEDCDSYAVSGMHSSDHCVQRVKMIPLNEAQKLETDFKLMETETLKQLHIICNKIAEANKLFERYLYLKNFSDPQTYKEVDKEESEMEAIEEELTAILALNNRQESRSGQ
jgi:hypothetical protein